MCWAVYYAARRIIVTSWYVETPTARYRIIDLEDVTVVLDPRRGLRWREIRAVHRGAEVVLFGTDPTPPSASWHPSPG